MSVFDQTSPFRLENSTEMGFIAEVVATNRKYRQFQFAALEAWVFTPVRLKQSKCYFNNVGRPVAFITWALVNEKTEQKLLNDQNYILNPSEWLEGDRLVVMDLCTNDGCFTSVFSDLKNKAKLGIVWKEAKSIRSIRRNDDGSIRKVTTWRDNYNNNWGY